MALSITFKSILIVGLLSISGCATRFDGNEQKALTDLRFLSDNLKICQTPVVAKNYVAVMKNTSDWLVIYHSSFDDIRLTSIYKNIKDSVDEIYDRYHSSQEPSPAYCENKLENIRTMATRAAKTSARRER